MKALRWCLLKAFGEYPKPIVIPLGTAANRKDSVQTSFSFIPPRNNTWSMALKSMDCPSPPPLPWPFGSPKSRSQPCLSDPNLSVCWPWPAPHPVRMLGAASVRIPRTPKWLVKLKRHLEVPFVFLAEVSKGLSLGWTWSSALWKISELMLMVHNK